MSERNLRLLLVGVALVTLVLPKYGFTNCLFTYWYSMEVLAASTSMPSFSISDIIGWYHILLFLLAVPILIVGNTYLVVSPRTRFKVLHRILLLVLFPVMWWQTILNVQEGPVAFGSWVNLVVVTAAALMEIAFIVRERRKEPAGVDSANNHSGTVPMRSKEYRRVSSALVVLASLSLVVLPVVFCLLLAGWRSFTYAYFWRLVSERQDEYEALNAQILEELPEYPGAELIYVLEEGDPKIDFDSDSRFLHAPGVQVFYGLEESVSEREILSYLGTSLSDIGWQAPREYNDWFTKDKRCVLVHIYSGELPAPLLSAIPTEYRDAMAQYDTLYMVGINVDADAIEGLPPFPQWIAHESCP